MSDGGAISQLSQGLGVVFEILNMDMKPYPCCRSAHCAIDGILEIREQMEARLGLKIRNMSEAEILAEQIQVIEIDTYLVGYKQCAVSDGCLHPNGFGCKILYTVFSRSRFPLRNRRHGAV